MSKFLKKSHEKGIIHIQSTSNNTIITLTDIKGNTQFWSSAGNIGFKNSRKSTSYAAQAVAELVATKALNLGFDSVVLKIKGLGRGKLTAIRALYKSKLVVTQVLFGIKKNLCHQFSELNLHMYYKIRVIGFEPMTSCSQNRRATRLRYTLIKSTSG